MAKTPRVFYTRASGSTSASGVGTAFSTADVKAIDVGCDLSAITAGGIIFSYQRLGADGIWYTVWSATSLTAVGQAVATIGRGQGVNAGLGEMGRIAWTVDTGPVTFSISVKESSVLD